MAYQAQQYGGFWIRFLAYLVDGVIFFIILFLVGAAGAFLGKFGAVVVSGFCLLGPLLYWGLMQASARQATFGKALLGLKVTNTSGERISLLRSLGREFAKLISAIPLMLGFLLAAFTGRKQALHDFVASTTVVREGHAHVVAALVVGIFGWLAPAAIAMFLGVGLLAGVMGFMMGQATKDAQSPPAQEVPATPRPAQPQAAAPSRAASGSDIEALLNTQLAGFEKRGTTRAGPVILELDNLLGSSFWIRTYVPPLNEFRGSLMVTVTRVIDAKGADLYDPGHQLESEFFQRVSLTPQSSPIPHFGGLRTVNVKQGALTDALQQVEGSVKLSLPLSPLTATFGAADVGKEQKVHRRVITLNSFNAKEAEVRFQGDSPLVAVIGYGADGKPVQTGMRPGSGGATKITFQAPAARMEMVIAESQVERQFPFTLTPTSVAGSPRVAAPVAVPSAPPKPAVVEVAKATPDAAATSVQEAPEAVYRKFHEAAIAHDFKELRKWGTAAIGDQLAAAPAAERDATIAFLGGMMPKSYTVTGKEFSPDGAKATLRLSARVADKGKGGTVLGTVTLVKEGGAWKVLEADWGGDQASGPSPQTSEPKPGLGAPATASIRQSEAKPAAKAPAKPKAVTPVAVKSAPAVSATKPKAEVRRSESATTVAPSTPSTRTGDALLPCVYKPVMTDEEIARCR